MGNMNPRQPKLWILLSTLWATELTTGSVAFCFVFKLQDYCFLGVALGILKLTGIAF